MKRQWGDWGRLTVREINATSGLFALGGTVVAATGVILAAPVVLALGGTLAAGTAGWCLYKGVPPKLPSPEDLLGQVITDLKSLDQVYPRLARVGVIGASQAGKSTLLANLEGEEKVPGRTDAPYANVVALSGGANRFIAFIDAAGNRYAQQFRVVDAAEHIVLFLDNAEGSSSAAVDKDRLKVHEAFMEQLAGHIRDSGKPPTSLHFILNKRDLWQNSLEENALRAWFQAQVRDWQKLATQTTVSSSEHSNKITEDEKKFIGILRKWAAKK